MHLAPTMNQTTTMDQTTRMKWVTQDEVCSHDELGYHDIDQASGYDFDHLDRFARQVGLDLGVG